MSENPSQSSDVPDSRPADSAAPAMSKTQKTINFVLWGVLVVVAAGMLIGKFVQPSHASMQVLFHTPAFALMDQDDKPFSDADLRGRPYVCDFIFTTCGMACPIMSRKLANVQKQTPADLRLVSFTVNPEHDTPAVLKEYAGTYGADPTRWHFLTGTPAQMATTIRGMNLSAVPATESSPILHDERFLLVDSDGNVRGIYDSNDKEKMQELITDATWLANSPSGRGW